MMKSNKIDLLLKKLTGELTENDIRELENWHAKYPDNQQLTYLLENIRINEEVTQQAENNRSKILKSLHAMIRSEQRKKIGLRIAAIAASFILLIGISNMFSYRLGQNQQSVSMVNTYCPLGVRASIILPDYSEVILNSGSTLTYPATFTDKERKINLKGEAFFKITKNPDCPFIVHTTDMNIKVLGTEFNVNAYPENHETQVTLEKGIVKVALNDLSQEKVLKPNQQAIFRQSVPDIRVITVEAKSYSAWKENSFYFRNQPLEEIMKILSRHFNQKIIIQSDSLRHIKFTGEFIKQENLKTILDIITLDKRINYKRDKDMLLVYENQ